MTYQDDAAIVTLLEGIPSLHVHVGTVKDSDDNAKTISAPLPYVVFHARLDVPIGDSLAGDAGARLDAFWINGVGETPEQAKLALQKAASVLDRKHIAFSEDLKAFVRRGDSAFAVGKDPVWTRPDGGPLFFGNDAYSVALPN